MTERDSTIGAEALALVLQGKDPPEIARILTAKHSAAGRHIGPDEARDIYQTEFRRLRADQ